MTKQLRIFIAELTRAQEGAMRFEQRLQFMHGALAVRSNSMKAIAAVKERFIHYHDTGNDASIVPVAADIILVKKHDFPRSEGNSHAFQGDVFCHDQDNDSEFLWQGNRVLVQFAGDPQARISIIVNQPGRTVKPPAKKREAGKVPLKGGVNFVNWEEMADLLFLVFARIRGNICLHAACLSHHGRGLLITGSSGSGKSTAALSLLRGGFTYHSDEITVIPESSGDPYLVSGLLLNPRIRARIASLYDLEKSIHSPISGASISQALPARVIAAGKSKAVRPFAVVVIDYVRQRKTHHQISDLDEQSALVMMLSQVLDPTSHTRPRQVFESLCRLTGMSRLFKLEAGTDLASLPAFLKRHAFGHESAGVAAGAGDHYQNDPSEIRD